MDPPLQIVESALAEHAAMVKQMRGVPGVLPAKVEEGMAPRHCALSLVGEPIMYPEIGALVSELHRRRISTFLVTNAQFPDAIVSLAPVTQLYVSVDAATKDTLKAVDRPLFSDFWERFHASLSALRTKAQRTVYRLTLVAGYNITDADGYAALVDLGTPDFIEIKGVTFCGAGNGASALTMANVPYHADVVAFALALADAVKARGGGEYGLACEHAHSCCTLLARRDRFWREADDGAGGGVAGWHTHIDYEKFQDLVAAGTPFTSADYCLPTPAWAVAGAPEAGFSPAQTRFKKERNHPAKAPTAGAGTGAVEA
jgi:tRNA wybutosine-synthesizing protein 1